MADMKKVALQVRLPTELHSQLKGEAEASGMTLNGFLVERLKMGSVHARLSDLEEQNREISEALSRRSKEQRVRAAIGLAKILPHPN